MDLFEDWFEAKVLPQLQPGQIFIMDNASIHRSDVVEELCLDTGIQLEFLPPYSPDYNPIEPSFDTLELWVKRYIRMICWQAFSVTVEVADTLLRMTLAG